MMIPYSSLPPQLLIRACVPIILWSGCGALRVAIPKEAQVFRDKIISDALSYSYSALEFGASNETQFKTWSVVKNLSKPGHANKSHHEQGYEDSRWPSSNGTRKPKPHWPTYSYSPAPPPRSTIKSSAVQIFPPQSPLPPPQQRPSAEVYPQFGFHPLLFSTPSLPVIHFNGFRSSTVSPTPRIVLNSGIVSVSNNNSKKTNSKQLGRLKKGKSSRDGFRKGKLRPVGLDHFNTGVQQALHISLPIRDLPLLRPKTSTANPFPNLSPGYSRVTQNLPNSLPSVIYGTTNHVADGGAALSSELLNGNNTWIPILGPTRGSAKGSSSSSSSSGSNGKAKKLINLSRVLKNKSRPRHRYSSNYSNNQRGSQLKMRSHRLAGILSNSQKSSSPTTSTGSGVNVITVYPNKNYSTVTARSRVQKTTTTTYPGSATTTHRSTGTAGNAIEEDNNEYDDDEDEDELSRIITSSNTRTTTEPGVAQQHQTTTVDSQIIHARITKIPNRPRDVVVLNVTTQFPGELDEKVRARLKAIRKIVRRLP